MVERSSWRRLAVLLAICIFIYDVKATTNDSQRSGDSQVRHKRFLSKIFGGKGILGKLGGLALKIGGLFLGRGEARQAISRPDPSIPLQLETLCDKLCISEWSQWSQCSQNCGGGKTERTRKVKIPPRCKKYGCRHSTKQETHCNTACPNGGTRKSGGGCTCPKGFTGHCCTNDVTCPYPGKPKNGIVDGTWPAKYGMVATYSCNEGYALVGSEQLLCKETGKWDGAKPSCERIKCSMPKSPKNGEILNQQASYQYGDHIVFGCFDGYKLRGPQRRQCMRFEGIRGRWTLFTPQCIKKKCGDPGTPEHSEREGNSFKFGDSVKYTCAKGYRLAGSSTRKCIASGSWNGREPICQKIICNAPKPPKNGEYIGSRYTFGSFVLFECFPGYILDGNKKLQCMADGHWNSVEPKCKAAICGNLGTPENGAKDGGVYYYPHNVTFSCFAGYVIRGARKITCQQNGKWNKKNPKCEACPKDHYYEEIVSAGKPSVGSCQPCPQNTHTLTTASTSIKQCICNKGFKRLSNSQCSEITCPILSSPVSGHISKCGNKLNSNCDFSCTTGFIIDKGSSRRRCQENGEWSGKSPMCSACPLNTYKSDERSCLPCPKYSHTTEIGQVKTGCLCDSGYHGRPGGPCKDVNECSTRKGKGPCADSCENTVGGYRCSCSIPGYVIDKLDKHTCIVEKECRNLTSEDAPDNGGLVCHWYREENSQQCSVRCNPGYEFPSRVNNYEYCGPNTGYIWSYQERNDTIEPCIEEFFPEFRLEANSSYFVRNCKDLTESEKDEVKRQFAETLTAQGICKKRKTKVCEMRNVGIICGKTQTRRRRGVEYQTDEVDFAFDISALKPQQRLKDCDKICKLFKIPKRRCSSLCVNVYKRFLKAAVMYSKRQLTKSFSTRKYLFEFKAAHRDFEPSELEVSDLIVECEKGMKSIKDACVPCLPGTFYSEDQKECIPCARGYYQSEQQQIKCLKCPVGQTTKYAGSSSCTNCTEGFFGENCANKCDCVHGSCDVKTGQCLCSSGWEGQKCNQDIMSCSPESCYEDVKCTDIKAPGTGFRCGNCPPGALGNGVICTLQT